MSSSSNIIVLTCAAGFIAGGGLSAAAHEPDFRLFAQNEATPAQEPAKPPRPRRIEKKAAPARAAAPAPAAPPIPAAAPTGAATPDIVVSQKLTEAGAGCTGRIDSIARDALAGAKGFVPVSTWFQQEPKKHMAAVVVGQNYGAEAKVPHGLTGIVAAPGPSGEPCEGYTFQVMPSPLSCTEIQTNFLKTGNAVADLAGFPLLRNARNQVALIPAAGGGGCVVVSVRTEY